MSFKLLATVGLVLASTTAVVADEAWTTPYGDVFWDQDVGNTAIFQMASPDGPARIYVPGLVSDIDNRGTFNGYWIALANSNGCESSMTGPDGVSSNDWGRVLITFEGKTFPSNWIGTFSRCFGDFEGSVQAVHY